MNSILIDQLLFELAKFLLNVLLRYVLAAVLRRLFKEWRRRQRR